MAATALLKFQQGPSIGADGTALIIADNANVQITNSDNTDVVAWRLELLYAPPGAVIEPLPGVPHVLAEQSSSTPSYTFTPTVGVRGTYRFRLTVQSVSNTDQDIRCIAVPLSPSGIVLPPLQVLPAPLPRDTALPGAKPDEMNFDGQRAGWAGGSDNLDWKLLNDALRLLNQIPEAQLTALSWSKLTGKPYTIEALEPDTTGSGVTTDAVETGIAGYTITDSTLDRPWTYGFRVSGVAANGSAVEQEFVFKVFRPALAGAALHMSPTGEATGDPTSASEIAYGNVGGTLMQNCSIRVQTLPYSFTVYVTGLAATTITWSCALWRYRP